MASSLSPKQLEERSRSSRPGCDLRRAARRSRRCGRTSPISSEPKQLVRGPPGAWL